MRDAPSILYLLLLISSNLAGWLLPSSIQRQISPHQLYRKNFFFSLSTVDSPLCFSGSVCPLDLYIFFLKKVEEEGNKIYPPDPINIGTVLWSHKYWYSPVYQCYCFVLCSCIMWESVFFSWVLYWKWGWVHTYIMHACQSSVE